MIDGRLLVPAVAAWLGVALLLSWGVAAVVAVVTLLVMVAAIRRSLLRSVLLAVVFVLVGAVAGGALGWRLAPAPLAAWTEQGVTCTVRGTVTGPPSLDRADVTDPAWARDRWILRVSTDTVSARGVTVQVRVPMSLAMSVEQPVPARGSRIEVTAQLSPLPLSTGASAELRPAPGSIRVLSGPRPLDAFAAQMAAGLEQALEASPDDAAALVRGLALGDNAAQSPQLTEQMRASGLAHLVAVSGGNIAIVVGSVVGLAAVLRAPLFLRVVLGLIALAYYAFLVGFEPSVLRASVMGAVTLLGVLLGGRRGGPAVLATGVLGLVLLQPSLAVSWGFALSAGATAGIVLLAPVIRRRLAAGRRTGSLPSVVIAAVAITVAAQAATLPILIAMGGAAGWVSVPANLAAMPAVAPVTTLGLAAAVIAPAFAGAADILATGASWPARWIVLVAQTATRLPAPTWPVGSWPSGWTGLLLVVLAGAVGVGLVAAGRVVARSPVARRLPHPESRPWAGVLVATAMLGLVIGLSVILVRRDDDRPWPPPGWLLIMCDVGQGDALLLRSGPGAAVVVDTGRDPEPIDACLADAGVTQIPAVVLTHFHADHVRGLSGVLRSRAVGAVLTSPLRDPREQFLLVSEVLAGIGVPPEAISAGDHRRVGQVEWRALWPSRFVEGGSGPNNASLVLLATVDDHSILLTGDIEPEAQEALLPHLGGLDLDAVKVPHHGSRFQLPAFAEAARAPLALVSVGIDNEYGHPAPEALALYSGDGVLVLRTDLLGDVALVDTGEGGALGAVTRDGMLRPA